MDGYEKFSYLSFVLFEGNGCYLYRNNNVSSTLPTYYYIFTLRNRIWNVKSFEIFEEIRVLLGSRYTS